MNTKEFNRVLAELILERVTDLYLIYDEGSNLFDNVKDYDEFRRLLHELISKFSDYLDEQEGTDYDSK